MAVNKSILQRIQHLEDRKSQLSGPVDELSRSLWDFGRELAGLDGLGRMLEAHELGISQEALDSMARSYMPRLLR